MGVQWTKEQQEVIRLRDRNILVSAAAGSGKTAVLVERILSKITDKKHPVDIDRLLIMTFTRAAAGEMKVTISAFVISLYIFLFYMEFPGSTLIFGLCQYFPDLYFHFQTSISDLHNRKSQDFIFFIFFIEKLSECHSRNISS